MATLTVNPTTSREGYILNGSSVSTSDDKVYAGKSRWSGTTYEWRGFLGFDTSSLGSGVTVTSATLTVYVWRSGYVSNNFRFYAGANKFSTPLARTDWDDWTGMTLAATKSTSGISTSQSSPTKWDIPIPATAVSTTGNTDIEVRLDQNLYTNGEYYFLGINSVDNSNSAVWPVLTVEYTTGGGPTRRRVFFAHVR